MNFVEPPESRRMEAGEAATAGMSPARKVFIKTRRRIKASTSSALLPNSGACHAATFIAAARESCA